MTRKSQRCAGWEKAACRALQSDQCTGKPHNDRAYLSCFMSKYKSRVQSKAAHKNCIKTNENQINFYQNFMTFMIWIIVTFTEDKERES